MTAPSPISIGQAGPLGRGEVVAGKYRVEETAGAGGMAVVYAAHHLVLDQRVAVKVLVGDGSDDELTTERFVREAQAAARLQSEHAVRVMDAGVLPSGQPYLVMEYLEGCDLAELLGLSGPLEVPEFADYMLQALEGLAHAHAAGIVHRDLKPSNLFLALRADGSNAIKVLDFGISKSTVETGGTDVTKLTGQAVLGSPAYMSPEQVRNASKVDGRSDVWSLGVSMYELLTGKMPFDGDGVGATLAAILEADAVPVHDVRPGVPEALSGAVMRCLRRNRDERWADVGELAQALAPFGTGATADLPERIGAILAHAARIRRPTPLGAFPVASLAALAASSELDASSSSGPHSVRKAFVSDGPRQASAYAETLEQPRTSVITLTTRRKGRLSRLAFLAGGVCAGAIVVLVAMRGRGSPAASSSSTLASPPKAPAAPAAQTSPPPRASTAPTVTAPPTPSATAALPSASAAPAAAGRRNPRHVPPSAPAATGSGRPSILHSRN